MIIEDTTKIYGKGPLVKMRRDSIEMSGRHRSPNSDDLKITDSSKFEKVDMIFFDVVVNKEKAKAHKSELEDILMNYPNPKMLGKGLAYREFSEGMGIDEASTLRFMALGSSLGMWNITTMGSDDKTVKRMSELGFVMISGWRPWKVSEPKSAQKV
jgi:hypothetical protein